MSDTKVLTLINSGSSLLDEKNFKEAIIIFDSILKDNNNNVDALFLKGNAYKGQNLYESALEMYNKALKLNPKSVEIILNKANCLKKLNRIDEAVLCYDQIIYYNPNHIMANNNRGLCLVQKKKFVEAINCFQNVIKHDPKNYGAFYNIGNCFHSIKKYKESLEYYDKSITINPQYSDNYFNKGNSFDELGDYNNALICYDLALKYDDKMVDAYFNKGLVLNKKSEFESAINCYDKTIKLNPKNEDAYYRKGVCLEELKEYKEAVISLNEAIKISPQNPTYISERANAYLKLNDILNGFNDLNFARKILEEENKIKEIGQEMLKRSKKNVEKLESIDVIDVLELLTEKIDFVEGNRNIKKEYEKNIKPMIKKKFGIENIKKNEDKKNNFDKFIFGSNYNVKIVDENNNALPSNSLQGQQINKQNKNSDKMIIDPKTTKYNSSNQLDIGYKDQKNLTKEGKFQSNKNVQNLDTKNIGATSNNNGIIDNNLNNKIFSNDNEDKKSSTKNMQILNQEMKPITLNLSKSKSKANDEQNMNILTIKQQINQQTITNIQKSINKVSKINNKGKISPKELKNIYDMLFKITEEVKKHELYISKLRKKVDLIESELETKLTNHRKVLHKELDILLRKDLLTAERINNILEYFNGFNSCFYRFYLTSQMITQGQFQLSDNKIISICSYLVSMVPVIGKALADVGNSVAHYFRNKYLNNQAKKFLGVAADCTDLSQIIGITSLNICKNKQMEKFFSNVDHEQMEERISKNYSFVENIANKIEDKINFSLFNHADRNPYNKYGEFHANCIIKNYLEDGFDPEIEYEKQFEEFVINYNFEENKVENEDVTKPTSCFSILCLIF